MKGCWRGRPVQGRALDRGVQPVGLVFRGRVEHRDSPGNQIAVTSGGMQRLMAGSGFMHEETPAGDDDGVLHAAQLWVNLPADLVAMGGGHVMNTAEEVAQAFADERAGHMGHLSATRIEGALS